MKACLLYFQKYGFQPYYFLCYIRHFVSKLCFYNFLVGENMASADLEPFLCGDCYQDLGETGRRFCEDCFTKGWQTIAFIFWKYQ